MKPEECDLVAYSTTTHIKRRGLKVRHINKHHVDCGMVEQEGEEEDCVDPPPLSRYAHKVHTNGHAEDKHGMRARAVFNDIIKQSIFRLRRHLSWPDM